MIGRSFSSKCARLMGAAAILGLLLSSSIAFAQEFEVKSVAEKTHLRQWRAKCLSPYQKP
jgi:hypothetical protein